METVSLSKYSLGVKLSHTGGVKMLLKKIVPLGVIILVLFNFFLAAWMVLHKDISFTSEVARDFLLLDELARKKVILIGPNSSTGLFHGPLWTYLNFPAYILGRGNPVVVGWFWVLLIVGFTFSNYFIAKKLFGQTVGYLFSLMTSLYMVFHAGFMYNPHGAMLFIPASFFFFVQYVMRRKRWDLLLHLITIFFIIQMQLADGIPLFILSTLAITVLAIKDKQWSHLFFFLLVPLFLSNFIIFDLRHNRIISNLLIHFINSPARDRPDYLLLAGERINLLLSSVEILHLDIGGRNLVLFIFTLVLVGFGLKQNKFRVVYLSFFYLYGGYFLLSLFNTGPLLYFYLFPLFPLVFLIFSSLINSRFRLLFLPIFILVYIVNLQTAVRDLRNTDKFIGKAADSWQFIFSLSQKIYKANDAEFGYFVYAPYVLAYEGKYAMLYTQRLHANRGFYFSKKPVTYIISAPTAPSNPYLSYSWWVANRVRINKEPVAIEQFANGYKIEKYLLTDEETHVPFDQGIDPGLTFR